MLRDSNSDEQTDTGQRSCEHGSDDRDRSAHDREHTASSSCPPLASAALQARSIVYVRSEDLICKYVCLIHVD